MESFIDKVYKAHSQCPSCPPPKVIHSFFENVLGIMFPEHAEEAFLERGQLEMKLFDLQVQLRDLLNQNTRLHHNSGEALSKSFFEGLDEIYDRLQEDVEAMFTGDPAAKSKTEIVRSYPGFYAIAAYRIAHSLYQLGVSIVPRMITEFAHSRTGVDIHPGATIGRYFCIDHGTGVVIGETTVVGNHVKIYQGVTLGAVSVNKEDADKKRHPTIEDHVIIYAGATILGGDTVVGKGSVIGGNVWLTKSIPAGSKIYYQVKMYDANSEATDFYLLKNNS
ncbi:MAG TPA: serine O-acetyltransferase EpsC [Cyclobacteriaceae bacterium]|nr:serine O-acetyltransferase EpsC [Cyclobacteriaceae bacterium]